jgi:thiol-disulfide isomerase/thioredoxin
VPERVVVPSCVRIGKTVEDFALYGLDGNVWQLSKKRQGKLVLLDFWFTSCPPCRAALPFLAELDRKYRRYGLEVVGIANEEGSLAEKQAGVRQARTQHGLNYPLLLAGGGSGDCPVLRQLEVASFPTVVMLDASGKIVWRSSGDNPQSRYALEMEIRRRLGLPLR